MPCTCSKQGAKAAVGQAHQQDAKLSQKLPKPAHILGSNLVGQASARPIARRPHPHVVHPVEHKVGEVEVGPAGQGIDRDEK